LKGLEEDRVFQELSLLWNLKNSVTERAYAIIHYAFTDSIWVYMQQDEICESYVMPAK